MNKVKLVLFCSLMQICGTTAWTENLPSNETSLREPASVAAELNREGEEIPSRLWNPEWRTKLAESGFDWSAIYMWNGVSNQSGGAKKGEIGFSVFDVFLNFDFEKMLGWKGGSFHIQHHTHGGNDPEVYISDYSGVNDFSPPYDQDSIISQAYIQQTWGEGSFDLLGGMYDLSAEFFVTDSSLNFLNNSFVIGSELTDPTPAELSVYPVNGPGIRFKWAQEKSFYFMAALMSGVARDPNYTMGTHPRMGNEDGYYEIVEAGLQNESESKTINKYAIGVWAPSKKAQKLSNSAEEVSNWGAYLLLDHRLLKNTGVFARIGKSNSDVSAVDNTIAIGLNQANVFTEDDQFGFGVSQSFISASQRLARENSGEHIASAETVIETFYRKELTSGLFLMPDLQFIKNPNMSKDTKDATVGSLRLQLTF